MAYNVIKGNVEFSGLTQGTIEDMVDDHSNQTIGGTKTFSQMVTASSGLSASIFYGDGTNLTGITEPAIVTYNGAATNRVIVGSFNNNVVSGAVGLSYNGSSLSVTGDVTASANVSASAFQGDGNALTNIGPSSLNLGNGLEDSSGLAVKLNSNSGLALAAGGVSVDANNLPARTNPLAGANTFPFYNGSATQKTTLSDISTYVADTLSIPSAQGSNTEIQFKNAGDFAASANLTFNSSTNLFTTVSGNFQTIEIEGQVGQNTILTLDKGENSASYVEFRNGGTKYAEIFGSSAENLKIRTTTAPSTFILGHYTEDVITLDANNTTFDSNKVTINQDLTVTGSSVMSSSVTIVTNSADATPHLHIHENDTEFGRISFTNNADTSGSITGYSHEWTLAASSSASGSQTDARFNIFYGDAQGDGNGLDLLGMNGIGDTAIKGTLALNCYQEDGTTSKVDPSTLVGHAHIYSKLISGHAEMFVRDSDGNVTQISPHTPEGEWQYFSKNTRTGKVVRVNMEKMIRKLEQITGESFMEEWYEDPTD